MSCQTKAQVQVLLVFLRFFFFLSLDVKGRERIGEMELNYSFYSENFSGVKGG